MRVKTLKSRFLASTLLILVGTSMAMANPQCKSIFAVQQDRLVTQGCTSPVAFCAGGTFTGNHGFRGNFFFSALSFDPIVSDPNGRLVVPGISTYTTSDGV